MISKIVISIISLSGILFGFLLKKLTLDELKEKRFVKKIVLARKIVFAVTTFFSIILIKNFYIALILIFLFILFFKRRFLAYASFALMFLFGFSFLTAQLIFIYGLLAPVKVENGIRN
ncbi:hypothetical protein DRJ19_04160 [Candidatus Woesearchaeota archaeon]|nr:MAG: hypothetical protein DRJ19_04160 [Candidatus Woesearchaeota archaeon]